MIAKNKCFSLSSLEEAIKNTDLNAKYETKLFCMILRKEKPLLKIINEIAYW